jgi:hypothetical protein
MRKLLSAMMIALCALITVNFGPVTPITGVTTVEAACGPNCQRRCNYDQACIKSISAYDDQYGRAASMAKWRNQQRDIARRGGSQLKIGDRIPKTNLRHSGNRKDQACHHANYALGYC